ncbi:MAG: hypothetical protein JO297_07875 [Nitrososphaeraceae archaeon]|nr:hypothetical protein [Nitrososphaeraceae archaeon]
MKRTPELKMEMEARTYRKERNEKLQEDLRRQQVRIVRVSLGQCKKIAKLMGIPEDIIESIKETCTDIYEVIDGEDLWTIMDHYPTNEQLEQMGVLPV